MKRITKQGIWKPAIGDVSDGQFNVDYADGDVFIVDNLKDLSKSETVQLPTNIIILCTQGRMQMDVNGKTLSVKKFDIIMCPPNVIVSNQLFSTDFECKIIGLTDKIVQSFLHNNVTVWNQTVYINKVSTISIDESDSIFIDHFYELLRLTMKGSERPFRKEMMQSIISCALMGLCSLLANYIPVEIKSDTPRKDIVFRNFLQLLTKNEVKRHPVEFYAKELHLSPKYLSLICKRSSGKTALEWIDEYVLEDVRYYLRNTDYSIKEIADTLGFPNLSFFGKYIKRHFGIPPKNYRIQLRQ